MPKAVVLVELYYDGDWHDHTDDVLLRDPIEVSRYGSVQGPVAARANPSTMTMSIKNPTGTFSIRKPTSPLYGLLGRNTPVRLTVNGSIRATQEIESWPNKWTVDGKDVWAAVTANGILRRLGAPGTKQRVVSAITGTVLSETTDDPIAYYVLDEGTDATSLANLVDTTTAGSILTPSKPGEGDGLVEAPTFLGFTPDDPNPSGPFLAQQPCALLPVIPHTPTGTYTITFWHRFYVPHPVDAPYRNYHETVLEDTWISPDQDPTTAAELHTVYHRVETAGPLIVGFRMQSRSETDGLDTVVMNLGVPGSSSVADVSAFFNVDILDGWHEVQATLDQNGGDVDIELFIDGASVGTDTATSTTLGTITGFAAGRYGFVMHPWIPAYQQCSWAPFGLAHVSVHTAIAASAYGAVNGYAGETAGRRLERLCLERGIPFTSSGDLDETTVMGAQRAGTFLDSVYDAVDADGGILYEPRDTLGLGYRTRVSLYNQPVDLALSYLDGDQVAPGLEPVEDFDQVANDVTVNRHRGGSARRLQTTGRLSIREPTDTPAGIGRVDVGPELVLSDDRQCVQAASWLLHLGTWDEERHPVINVDLSALEYHGQTAILAAATAFDIGDRLTITDLPAWLPPEDIDQRAQSHTETVDQYHHTLSVAAIPATPYDVWVAETDTTGNLSRVPIATGSTLTAEALDATETGVDILSARVRLIDTVNYPTQFPFDVVIGGERMRVTAITGTTLAQTMTVTRSINGVSKTHATNAPVQLFRPPVIAR